jgi:hypothetical protein
VLTDRQPENGWNRRAICSRDRPIPESTTSKRSAIDVAAVAWGRTFTWTAPRSVNLIALLTRFVRICRSRPGSPRTHSARSISRRVSKARPLAVAAKRSDAQTSSTIGWSANARSSKSSLPASILEKSRMSLITVSSELPALKIVVAYPRCSAVKAVSRRISVIPRTPLIGVLISWLMFVRKRLFSCEASASGSRFVLARQGVAP